MFQIITLPGCDGQDIEVGFLANAATPRRYKAIFGDDLLHKFMGAEVEIDGRKVYNIDFLQELAYVMAMQSAAKSDSKVKLEKLNENTFLDWLEQFDSMAIENNASAIVSVYIANTEVSSEAKKNIEEQTET